MALIQLNLRELNVLVVDDSRTARQVLLKLLRDIGVGSVAQAEDGADALGRLRGFAADVVVCDLHMVPLDGIEFTRLLRSAPDSPNPCLPVLMLTADATQAQLANAVAAGVNGFMSKPVKSDDLRRHLQTLFSRPLVFVRDGRYLKPVRQSCRPRGPGADIDPGSDFPEGMGPEPPPVAVPDRSSLLDPAKGGAALSRADLGVT